MKTTVNCSDFEDAFRNHNRQDQFTYDGKKALYDWLKDLEDGQGEEIELDVIALCCEFTEYRDIVEFQANYSHAGDYETIEDIENDTTIIKINDDSFIIQDF